MKLPIVKYVPETIREYCDRLRLAVVLYSDGALALTSEHSPFFEKGVWIELAPRYRDQLKELQMRRFRIWQHHKGSKQAWDNEKFYGLFEGIEQAARLIKANEAAQRLTGL